MKTLFAVTFAGLVAPLCQAQIQNNRSIQRGEIAEPGINLVLSLLSGAQTIAVCDFSLPAGTVVTKVIRGESVKAGELWNDSFPRTPILVFERYSDNLGSGGGQLVTCFFVLDESRKFVVLESSVLSKDSKDRTLVPLEEIEKKLLKK